MNAKKTVAAVFLITAAIIGLVIGFRPVGPVANNVTLDSTSLPKKNVESTIQNSTSARAIDAGVPLVPKLVGYLAIGSERWFALSLPMADASLETQSWFMLGQKIAGFEITGFDNLRESILLKDMSGREVEVKLSDGKVADSDEEFRRRVRQLIDTSPRAIRDLYQPMAREPKR